MPPLDVSKSLELWRRAVEVIPGGSQTMSKRPAGYAFGAYPIYASRGQGARIWDVDGNEYIDYVLALGPITLGYCYPAVDEAVREQLDRGIIYGLLSPLEVEVAELLCETIPCAEMVRFLKGGAEATQAAARIARAYTGRDIILNCGYRGWSDQWTAARDTRGIPKALADYIVTFPFNDPDALEQKLREFNGRVAMVFLEPASAAAPEQGYLQQVRELCDRYGVLLGFDEIVTGFRLAPGGGQEYFGVTADIACFAKGMANGMPLAAVVGRRDVMKVAEQLIITVTYGGEALSLAAAKACLLEYRSKPVTQHMWDYGRRLLSGLERLAAERSVPLRWRGLEPMAYLYFDVDSPEFARDLWTLFAQEMAARGVLLRPGGLLFVTFSHGEEEMQQTLAAAAEALDVVAEAVRRGSARDLLRTLPPDVEGFSRF